MMPAILTYHSIFMVIVIITISKCYIQNASVIAPSDPVELRRMNFQVKVFPFFIDIHFWQKHFTVIHFYCKNISQSSPKPNGEFLFIRLDKIILRLSGTPLSLIGRMLKRLKILPPSSQTTLPSSF